MRIAVAERRLDATRAGKHFHASPLTSLPELRPMHRLSLAAASLLLTAACHSGSVSSTAPSPAQAGSARDPKQPLVEFEMMTWPEVKAAMDAGKTTALF